MMNKPDISFLQTPIKMGSDAAAKELVQPTETKTPGAEKTAEEIEAEAEAAGGFKPAEETRQAEDSQPPATAEPAKPKLTSSVIKSSAEATTIATDTAIGLALRFAYKLRSFTAVERRTISKHQQIFKARFRLEEKGKAEEFDVFKDNDALEALYHDWCEYNGFVNGIVVDEKKIQAIADGWERVYEYYQKDPGPWGQLVMAYLNAYGREVTPLFGF